MMTKAQLNVRVSELEKLNSVNMLAMYCLAIDERPDYQETLAEGEDSAYPHWTHTFRLYRSRASHGGILVVTINTNNDRDTKSAQAHYFDDFDPHIPLYFNILNKIKNFRDGLVLNSKASESQDHF